MLFSVLFQAKVVENFAVKEWGEMSKLSIGKWVYISWNIVNE